jgi:hypothetical protein
VSHLVPRTIWFSLRSAPRFSALYLVLALLFFSIDRCNRASGLHEAESLKAAKPKGRLTWESFIDVSLFVGHSFLAST